MYRQIEKCRICGNSRLERVLDLGDQMLTGVFPRTTEEKVTRGPLRLVKCMGDDEVCGLLQLEHSYDLGEMYGENYGYRSGLNASMVAHLHNKVRSILQRVELRKGDLVVDIGSNDSTTLQAYPSFGPILVGIDPTGIKFKGYYPPHIQLVPEFFSPMLLKARFPGRQAKVVTSFSMFYDLESPLAFMKDIHEILADDGIWVFEQSYMPTMLERNAYDTVCHEHREYYALRQIKWMADRAGFRIIDVEFNDINGGSFSVAVAKLTSPMPVAPSVAKILDAENERALETLAPYEAFAKRVVGMKHELLDFFRTVRAEQRTVAALGASTKGNVVLQYCGISPQDIFAIGEINSDKFGCYAPGSWIPIVPEEDLMIKKPDYCLVLPWHFRAFFESRKKYQGLNLVFPLPRLEVVRP